MRHLVRLSIDRAPENVIGTPPWWDGDAITNVIVGTDDTEAQDVSRSRAGTEDGHSIHSEPVSSTRRSTFRISSLSGVTIRSWTSIIWRLETLFSSHKQTRETDAAFALSQ